jgi:transcriptional regulator with PAS, ATPase and Fis domain
MPIELQPLRRRKEDIPMLVSLLIEKHMVKASGERSNPFASD